ncbi:MAG: Holliday junction branch migration protein RuvA [Actinomycetota bacterium]
MIGSVRGTLLERLPSGEVLVEVSGIGYRVIVAPSTASSLGETGSKVFLHTHHHRREDAETLYGFPSSEQRMVFEALLSAHGVGPAMALGIMSVHSPSALVRVLANDDIDALCLVPGVGKKTAARLLIELKSKLDIPGLDIGVGSALVDGTGGGSSSVADVRSALTELGYGPEEVAEAVKELPDSSDTAELLRLALQRLAA